MKRKAKRADIKSNIIKRQANEIDELKDTIADLNITCEKKDEIINSIDGLRSDLIAVMQDLDDKKDKYDAIISELMEMKKIMNKEVFHNRWWIIRFLLK